MKNFPYFFLILFLSFSCCKDNPVQEYGTTLSQSLKKSEKVALEANLSELKKAIQRFSEEKGRLPLSINEIEAYTGQSIDKEKIEYNPETGEIRAK